MQVTRTPARGKPHVFLIISSVFPQMQAGMASSHGKKRKQPSLDSHCSGYEDEYEDHDCEHARGHWKQGSAASGAPPAGEQELPTSETTHMLGSEEAHPQQPAAFSSAWLYERCCICQSFHTGRHRDAELFMGETAMLRGTVAMLIVCFLFCTSAFVISASRYGLDVSDEYSVWFYGSGDSGREGVKKNITLSPSSAFGGSSPSPLLPAQMLVMERLESIYHNLTGT